MRINGFSSGMDIDSTVKQLMQVQRLPLDKLNQKKQTLLWQQEDYRTMNSKILDLKNTAFNMKLQSPYLTKKASSNNEDIIAATPTPGATDGIYKLKVHRLAESADLKSTAAVGATSGSDTIASIRTSTPTEPTLLIIGGEKGTATIEVNNTDSINSFVANFNSKASVTGVRVSYETNMDRFFFVSTTTGDAAKVELNTSDTDFLTDVLRVGTTTASKTGEKVLGGGFKTTPPDAPDLNKVIDSTIVGTQALKVNYKGTDYNFNVTSTTKIGDLIDNINASGLKGAGVTAGLDATSGNLTFKLSGNSGESISFSDQTVDGYDVVSKLGLPATSNSATVQGAAFTKPADPYIDNNKLINDAITDTQKFRINYDGKDYDFDITNKTTIGSLMTAINTSELGKLGITARLDTSSGADSGKLTFLTSDNTKQMTFSDQTSDSTNVLASLGLTGGAPATGTSYTYAQTLDTGLDAIVEFNGVSAEYASNTLSINGINFTAKKADPATEVSINVSQDIDSVYNSIKSFIDKYNDVLNTLNKKVSEERYRDYAPLTDDEKEAMEESQVKLWEEKARSGLLRNDSILSSTVNKFRTSFYESVSGLSSSDYKQLGEIGIRTLVHTEKGKLYIDETKLKEAITNNPEQVMRLFTSNDNDSKSTSGDGVALRIYEAADQALSMLKDKAGNSLMVNANFEIGKELDRLNKRVADMNRKMSALETRYYKQFTAMEQAMNKYNSQASYLAQLGGGA
ncbi:flagellar filament capping protein FliD [Paenibacillus sp. YYML68]|uniref:flagellar filament capping protein FliD n=1 Tax=Paenibacillus sp. YYML68 TaxID=2909250 RepID=UPI00248FC50D|nr:flagellar filament capping protein FliD [Paenibacillus sp. YYML68]